jgi:hypothetical protein
MPLNPEQYRSQLSPETRFMCDILSPGFDPLTFDLADKLRFINPDKLLGDLTIHRLYPHFYKIWSQVLQTPDMFGGTDYNSVLACSGLEPPWIDFNIRLKQKVEHNRLQMLQKTATLVRVVKEFEKEGIPVIALKGPALAQNLYGNFSMKASVDLDVLIRKENLYKAIQVLIGLNFSDNTGAHKFTHKQINYCLGNFQHIDFKDPITGAYLELHWKINHLEHLTNVTLNQIWDRNFSVINLAEHPVYILKPELEYLFLASHGLSHSFRRLQWLYDFTSFQNKYSTVLDNVSGDFIKENMYLIQIATNCAECIFNLNTVAHKVHSKLYIKHFLGALKFQANRNRYLSNWFDTMGTLILIKGYIRILKLLLIQTTSPRDWKILRLPDRLFFMYFLLRPFLYVYRLFFATNKY